MLVNLKKFYEENRRTEFVYKGNTHTIMDQRTVPVNLNSLQHKHKEGKINVYAPVEAYSEEWKHVTDKNGNFVSARPVEGTRKRDNLPPVAEQWKREYSQLIKKENKRVKDR